MRRAIYVIVLAAIWIASMLPVVFWFDNFLHGDGPTPLLAVAGAWMAATATVALAREGE